MKAAADHLPRVLAGGALRSVYVDLDGTLLGPGGSLFAEPDGVTTEAASALGALAEACVPVVLVTGRTREQTHEAARMIGAAGYIAEMGGLVVAREGRQERLIYNWGAFRGNGTPHEAMVRSGAGGYLLDAWHGRLEPHTPWSFLARQCSMVFRGHIDAREAEVMLLEAGYEWLRVQDNGIIPAAGRFPHLAVEEVHVYHLLPAGVNKGSGVALDRKSRALRPIDCIAIGDSLSDAAMAPEVRCLFLVFNGVAALGGEQVAHNVYYTERPYGEGFSQAVMPFLSGRAGG